jgi:hypothetical protein
VVEQVERLFAGAGGTGIPVHARLWVPRIAAGERWRCYPPCDCGGSVPAPESSSVATAATVLGQVTYGSRGELEASLAPLTGADAARMRRLVDEATDTAVVERELGGPAAALRDLRAVEAAVQEVAAGRVPDAAGLARLAVALRDPHVRDTCLAWSLTERAGPAETLWTSMVRALVGVALDRARHADPDHALSGLFTALLDQGVGPPEIRELVRGAGAAARERVGRG